MGLVYCCSICHQVSVRASAGQASAHDYGDCEIQQGKVQRAEGVASEAAVVSRNLHPLGRHSIE